MKDNKKQYTLSNAQALDLALEAIRANRKEAAGRILSNIASDNADVRLAQARLLETNEAAKACRAILSDNENHVATKAYLAGLLISMNRKKKGKELLAEVSGTQINDLHVWFDLAIALMGTKDAARALPCIKQALSQDGDWTNAWLLKGQIELQLGDLDQAIRSFHRVLSYVPSQQLSLIYLALCYSRKGLYEQSRHYRNLASVGDEGEPKIKLMKAHGELLSGDLKKGFDLYRVRHQIQGTPKSVVEGVNKLKHETSLSGKTVCVFSEQGSGDNIQFCRYLNVLKNRGAKVTLKTSATMIDLFSKSFPDVEMVEAVDPKIRYDHKVSLVDLPYVFDQEPTGEEYLKVPSFYLDKWKNRLSALEGVKVGFAWHGAPQHGNDALRSMSLKEFSPLFDLPGIQWISLQVNNKEALPKRENIHDFTSEFENFADTAAVMAHLDCIVGIDSSQLHLAGAIGVKAYGLLALHPDWRWRLGREDSDWYNTIHLLRQTTFKDWADVISRLKKCLSEK